jgi:membrane protein DedA with SNARE-associated domain
MHLLQESFIVFVSGLLLGPYAAFGVGAITESDDHLILYSLIILFADILGCAFVYALGYIFSKKTEKLLKLFGIQQESIEKMHKTMESKSLYFLFLTAAIIPQSVNDLVYVTSGILRMHPKRFFFNIFIANTPVTLAMVFFGIPLQEIVLPYVRAHLSITNYLFVIACTFLIFVLGKKVRLLLSR